jgi:hypothetical protein
VIGRHFHGMTKNLLGLVQLAHVAQGHAQVVKNDDIIGLVTPKFLRSSAASACCPHSSFLFTSCNG